MGAAIGTVPGFRPASCAGVWFPYFVVKPYWKKALVAAPRGSTAPFRVAPTGVMSVAAPVVGTGAAALATVAPAESRPSTPKSAAMNGVRRITPLRRSLAVGSSNARIVSPPGSDSVAFGTRPRRDCFGPGVASAWLDLELAPHPRVDPAE